MAKLTVISGQGGKLPAAFLLDMGGRRILFDLGEGPQPGVKPDLSQVGPVDAICLSHAHIDHVGSLDLAGQLGNPPVYATVQTFRQISEAMLPLERRLQLPVSGETEIAGLPVIVGRNGHAPGGIWLHFAGHGGVLYMGDWSAESLLLPFDWPPAAGCLVTDASYGDFEESLSSQVETIAAFAAAGAVLCVPAGGRGPEMMLALSGLGLKAIACPVVRREMERLAGDDSGMISAESRAGIAALLQSIPLGDEWSPSQVIVATEANAETGLAAQLLHRRDDGFRFLFSGHVPAQTPAWEMLQRDEARWLRWNVHPRLQDTMDLVTRTGAEKVVAAFVRPEEMLQLGQWLGARLSLERIISLPVDRDQSMKAAE
ncbi:MBL fold metallo-hydrolase [Mesorhizobium sp. 1M-11]|uniref:MBL fold metallo-hydrolase n=1 Tax=Mesorhizobium sp. 1M-11 TaxID=1529006 RepID=UPI0006C743A2|nr:MBL fold metallo-hydrolase [Mesorhizobium sp. 1M-11]